MASKKPGFVTNQRRGGVAVRSTSPQCRHSRSFGFEEDLGRLRILSPAPEPNGPGVARGRGHAVPKGAGEEERIRVEPVDAAFGFGQNEPLGEEGSCLDVEFAQHDGIAANRAKAAGWRDAAR